MVPTGGVSRSSGLLPYSIHCTILQRKGFKLIQDRVCAKKHDGSAVMLQLLSITVLQPIEFNNQAEGGISTVSMT
jgi:hypothetical protein